MQTVQAKLVRERHRLTAAVRRMPSDVFAARDAGIAEK
jgi:hypothetical protein